jgi:DNA polymerase-1
MGSDKLQQEAWEKYGVRLSPEQALAQRQQWFALYPGVRRWHNQEDFALVHDRIRETRSLLGRRRNGISSLPDRLSSQVLGIEADGLKLALVEMFTHRDEVPGARVVNVVHDEVLVECDENQAPEVAAWLRKYMEGGMLAALKGKAVTPVEVQIGPSWAGD